MPEINEFLRNQSAGGNVVDGDRTSARPGGLIEQKHVRHVLRIQAVKLGAVVSIGHRQDQALDTICQHGFDGMMFFGFPIIVAGQEN